MTDCTKYRKLIEKYLDGIIADGELAELKLHAERCPPCREEFDRCVLMQSAVTQAFSSLTAAEPARASLMEQLAIESRGLRPAGVSIGWLAGRRAAVAAGILLAAGLLVGFISGAAITVRQTVPVLTAHVPIRVAEVRGMVLVRHEGSGLWQALEAGSSIYLGDTFHAGANSACVLKFDDESIIGLNQNSMLVLRSYNGETQFYLEHGQLSAALESPHPPFFISTPHGRVEALGTEFTVTVE